MNNSIVKGYVINIGLTSCRLFSVLDDSTLKEGPVTSYEISDPSADHYLDGIIEHVKSKVLPHIKSNPKILQKVFVDAKFSEVFKSEMEEKDFIRRFYNETNLYFNVLTQRQTEENLIRLFGEIPNDTVVINIDSRGVDVLEIKSTECIMHRLPIRLDAIDPLLEKKKIGEKWNEQQIDTIKNYIKRNISKQLKNINAQNAIIIKEELSFMSNNGYPLEKDANNIYYILADAYKKTNREKVFSIDFRERLKERYNEETEINRFYGFKRGHIILETLFDVIGIKKIIPSNQHSIHGSIHAYVFNVVISGSTKDGRIAYMIDANKIIKNLGATVLSPTFEGKDWNAITPDSDYNHLKAIDDCDVLFICNKDHYVGVSTQCEIYYAYARRKTIAFWNEPGAKERFSFIPHEHWEFVQTLTSTK